MKSIRQWSIGHCWLWLVISFFTKVYMLKLKLQSTRGKITVTYIPRSLIWKHERNIYLQFRYWVVLKKKKSPCLKVFCWFIYIPIATFFINMALEPPLVLLCVIGVSSRSNTLPVSTCWNDYKEAGSLWIKSHTSVCWYFFFNFTHLFLAYFLPFLNYVQELHINGIIHGC